ncbi:methyl-accepting chemotaxis protein [Actinoplanes sp. NBRC 103695]|uniref:methyl-accepting chemotaxis protein n=1 Tax=Actinoplanes sp. NBRC 103695 TaxID=3032202 RepID=UPI0024A07821|nr:methyl-accepting chemotaxis protein [Actinoplanes sp. NBRC 103695]GLY96017.1 methyl-accepting chemotaxis protein [Actinoplanes sp. NBRC 103695]
MGVTTEGGRQRSRFADLGVNAKILLAIAAAVAVAVVVGVVGLAKLRDASNSAQVIYRNNVAGLEGVARLRSAIVLTRLAAANQAISQNDDDVTTYTNGFDTHVKEYEAALATYEGSHPAGNPATVAKLGDAFKSYVTLARTDLLPAGARDDLETWSKTRDQQVAPLMKQVDAYLEELDAAERGDAAKNAAAAENGYDTGRLTSILVMVLGSLMALVLGVVVARRIVGSLVKVQGVCEALAVGDLTRTSGVTSRDEPGRMAHALDTAIQNLRGTVRTMDGSATSLAGAAEEMTSTAEQIAGSAQRASDQAQMVSTAAGEVSRSVDTVSAGGEEMGASIREISQNAAEAARVAAEAVSVTIATSSTMNKLGESSAEIGNVIKVITSIAAQTNLLALNATIEAARAGDAGKGFAVVASEVKDLAQETARATEDISRRIEAIQADTSGAVSAIEEISSVIARISDFQTTIASAVEEQTATTSEMNRSVSEAARGTNEIAQNITIVADAAQQTSQGVAETRKATGELARMSSELNSLVAGFKY